MNPTDPPAQFQVSTRHRVEYSPSLGDATAVAMDMLTAQDPIVAIVCPDGSLVGIRKVGDDTEVLPSINVASFGLPFTAPFAVVSRSGFLITEHATEEEAAMAASDRCSASDTRASVYGAGNSHKLRHFEWDSWNHEPREISIEEIARQEQEAG